MRRIAVFASLMLLASAGLAQSGSASPRAGHVGMPIDWSSNHVVHSMVTDQEFADAAGKEPRVLLNWFRRNRIQQASAARKAGKKPPAAEIHRDRKSVV